MKGLGASFPCHCNLNPALSLQSTPPNAIRVEAHCRPNIFIALHSLSVSCLDQPLNPEDCLVQLFSMVQCNTLQCIRKRQIAVGGGQAQEALETLQALETIRPSGGTPCVNVYFAPSTPMWAATFKVNTGIMRLSILSYMLENKAQNMTLLVALGLLLNWEAQSFGSARVTHSSSFSSHSTSKCSIILLHIL